MSSLTDINNFHSKTTGLILPARKYRFSQLHNIEKVYAHSSDKHQCAKFLDNPIDAPRITFLGLKSYFQSTSSKHENLTQKVLTTYMRISRSWTEILIFNHHLSGPLTSYFKFLLTKTYLR